MKNLKVLTLVILMVTASAYARGDKGERRGRGFMKELDLSQEQIDKLKELKKANKEKINKKELRSKVKTLREELKKKFIANASDSDLKSIHNQIVEVRTQMATERFNKMLTLKSVLNAEQREKFINKKKRRKHGKRK